MKQLVLEQMVLPRALSETHDGLTAFTTEGRQTNVLPGSLVYLKQTTHTHTHTQLLMSNIRW